MKAIVCSFFLLFFLAFDLQGQPPKTIAFRDSLTLENDSMPHVDLLPITVFPRKNFNSKHQEQRYWRLVQRVKKVYPYAKEAGRLMEQYRKIYPPDTKRRDKKAYIKMIEKELFRKYGPELKKLSISDGRVLIKLIDRETDYTSYELIDELKGSVSAFFWQGVARVFGNNLKTPYDPVKEDRAIEEIIQLIDAGIL